MEISTYFIVIIILVALGWRQEGVKNKLIGQLENGRKATP